MSGVVEWFGTGFYGWPSSEEKWGSWELLRRIRKDPSTPWHVFGDFNEILFPSEKCGGLQKRDRDMKLFHQALSACELLDLGYSRSPFAWDNGWWDADNVRQRLDHFCSNAAWLDVVDSFSITHGARDCSDHCPVIINTHTHSGSTRAGKRVFQFEPMWLDNAECGKVVQQAWCR